MSDIDDSLIALLEHRDPAQRKKAVQGLAQSRNAEALPYLMMVYKNDADPHIRELAHKAGIYIRKNAPAASPSSKRSTTSTPAAGGPVKQEDREWAETFLRQALDRHMRGDDEFAYRNALKALKRNPDLMHDAETRGIVARITEQPEDEAIQYLLDWEERALRNAKKRKWIGDDSYRGVAVNLAIYWVVNVCIVLASFFFVLSYASQSGAFTSWELEAAIEATDQAPEVDLSSFVTIYISSLASDLINNGLELSALLPYALIEALRSVLSLLILYFVIHTFSMMFLHGEGTLPRMIRVLTPFISVVYSLMIPLLLAVFLIPLGSPQLGGLMRFLLVVYFFVLGFGIAGGVAHAYRFDIGRGCIAVVLTFVFFGSVSCGIGLFTLAMWGYI